ncbi:MAG: hypothetical protein OYL97_02530 [Candidatus Poribacteria bacterium]|nr:hypothetical protein [Candidatus Poribacteria bacterium]
MAQNEQMFLFRETETNRETATFEIERNCFKHLKENLSREATEEYETGGKHLTALNRFAQDQPNLISMEIPLKPPTEMADSSMKASDAVARQLMNELNMHTLRDQI